MVEGDQSVVRPTRKRRCAGVCVCVYTDERLPVNLFLKDWMGQAAVRLARLRGPSLLCLELEGLVSSMVPGGSRWGGMPRRSQ